MGISSALHIFFDYCLIYINRDCNNWSDLLDLKVENIMATTQFKGRLEGTEKLLTLCRYRRACNQLAIKLMSWQSSWRCGWKENWGLEQTNNMISSAWWRDWWKETGGWSKPARWHPINQRWRGTTNFYIIKKILKEESPTKKCVVMTNEMIELTDNLIDSQGELSKEKVKYWSEGELPVETMAFIEVNAEEQNINPSQIVVLGGERELLYRNKSLGLFQHNFHLIILLYSLWFIDYHI